MRLLVAMMLALLWGGAHAAEPIVEPVAFPLVVDGSTMTLVGTVIRPADGARHPVVVLSHGAWGPAERRREKARLDYAPLSTWLAARGFAVLVPMRRGYGASEGEMAESSGGCEAVRIFSSHCRRKRSARSTPWSGKRLAAWAR